MNLLNIVSSSHGRLKIFKVCSLLTNQNVIHEYCKCRLVLLFKPNTFLLLFSNKIQDGYKFMMEGLRFCRRNRNKIILQLMTCCCWWWGWWLWISKLKYVNNLISCTVFAWMWNVTSYSEVGKQLETFAEQSHKIYSYSRPVRVRLDLSIVLYWWWSLLPNALRPYFKIYCALPNLGTRTWI